MFCCYCLYPRNEILSLLWFLLEKLFFCWKSSWNIRPKTFCLPKYFGVMYTLPWNCPEEEKILEIFLGRGRNKFFRAGQGSVESFTGLGKSGHPFQARTCAPAHPWSSVSIFYMFNFYSTSAIAGVLWFAFGFWSPEIFRREHCILSNDCTNPNSTQAINKPQGRPP